MVYLIAELYESFVESADFDGGDELLSFSN